MSIHTIPQITINGSNMIFGGYPYNIKYNISYGDSGPSRLQIAIVSEDGKYNINSSTLNNTYCNPYNISIGDQLRLTMYLEDFKRDVSPGGNTLNLSFIDTSRLLDVIHVGLYKRHGLKSQSNLIIVGREINPCSDNPYLNPNPISFYDPCHPCITSQKKSAEINFIDCIEKSKYEILDVKYNFTELLSKLPFPVIGGLDPNPTYFAQYTGKLREVLSAWCRDFGWFFYWDNGRLIFRDLRNTIQVTAKLEDFCPNVLEYSESFSMRDSVKTATITNFSRPGDPAKTYQCQEAKYIECTSLQQNGTYSMPLTITPDIDRVAAGLAYYNEDLRNLYYFYTQYQMYNLSNYYPGKQLKKLGMTILSSPIVLSNTNATSSAPIDDQALPQEATKASASKSNIDPFSSDNGGFLSKKQSKTVDSIKNAADFYECIQLLDYETQWKIIDKPENYFFFLAEYNETIAEHYIEEERAFADFLHKYAVYIPNTNDPFWEDYDFALDNLCGVQYFVNTGNVTYNALGDNMGSYRFYNTSNLGNKAGQGTLMGELPFARFLSIIRDSTNQGGLSNAGGALPFKLIVAERGRNSFSPEPGVQSDSGYSSIRDYNLLNQMSKFLPYKVANKNNNKGESIFRKISTSRVNGKKLGDSYLFLGYKASQDSFKITEINSFNDAASNGTLFDGKPLNKATDPRDQRQKIIYQYPELKCKIIGNHSYNNTGTLRARKIVFKTPLSSFQYIEPTDALFGLVIEKTVTKKRIIKKVESFNTTNLTSDTCNYANLEIIQRNISDDSLSVLSKKTDICEFNAQTIQSIHEQFAARLALNYTQPTITKTFKIAGIELSGYTPTIDNGLISLEIGIDPSNGIYSVYEFGTRLMRLPNENTINYNILDTAMSHGAYTNTVNYLPLLNNN